MIGTPEVDNSESRINAHSIAGFISYSLAKEYKCLCEDEERINVAKSHSKYKKREGNNIETDVITYKIKMMLIWRE